MLAHRLILVVATTALLTLSGCSCDRSGVDWNHEIAHLRADHQDDLCRWQSELLPFPDGETAQCPGGEITFDRQQRYDDCSAALDALPDECELVVHLYEDCILLVAEQLTEDPCLDSEQLIENIQECEVLIECRNAG